MTDTSDATKRFTERAEFYARHRPSYPEEMFVFLRTEVRLEATHVIVDLGSGTGILSEPFLRRGHTVYGVEPNGDMRAAAETALESHHRFQSVNGTAETTGLETSSIDLAVAGQAFHWFDPAKTQTEVRRILRPMGKCALMWNDRLTDTSPFLNDYEKFLSTWGTDYDAVRVTYENPDAIGALLDAEYTRTVFANRQVLDRVGLRGRVLSSSYMPQADDPRSDKMLEALDALFEKHQENSLVQIDYNTNLYLGSVRD